MAPTFHAFRYKLDAVLTALINELLVAQPDEPELWMAKQLSEVAKSCDAMLPRRHVPPPEMASTWKRHRPRDGADLEILDLSIHQKLVVAETATECEAAAALMLSKLAGLGSGKSTVALVGLDTEWAPAGKESVVRLALQQLFRGLVNHCVCWATENFPALSVSACRFYSSWRPRITAYSCGLGC